MVTLMDSIKYIYDGAEYCFRRPRKQYYIIYYIIDARNGFSVRNPKQRNTLSYLPYNILLYCRVRVYHSGYTEYACYYGPRLK